MTITIPAQADEIRIVEKPPTIADAQLLLQVMHVNAVSGADNGWNLLDAFETPPTLGQLRKRHPPGSQGYREVGAFLSSCETVGTFVKHGLLSSVLTHDLFWVAGAWARAEKVCKGMRRESGTPALFENFEALAKNAP